jgi:hypothetical protein
MNTPKNDDRLQAIETDQVEQAAQGEEAGSLTELGKVSDTQGGIFGYKVDSGLGWQYF